MTLHFSCKDPQIAAHYRREFLTQFSIQACLFHTMTEDEIASTKAKWKLAMYAEARKQEHYDYEVINGVRRVIYDSHANHQPVLLIPEVEVE